MCIGYLYVELLIFSLELALQIWIFYIFSDPNFFVELGMCDQFGELETNRKKLKVNKIKQKKTKEVKTKEQKAKQEKRTQKKRRQTWEAGNESEFL